MACYVFPYLISNFSLTVLCHENVCLSLNGSDSSPCHSQADNPWLHALIRVLCTFGRWVAVHLERNAHLLSRACTATVTVQGTLPPTAWVSVHLGSHSPTPLCPLVWLVAAPTSSQAPSVMAAPEERVGSLHRCHSNTFQRCSLQSLWVFQFSMAALLLRGYVYPRNKQFAKYVSCSSVKYALTVRKNGCALNKRKAMSNCWEVNLRAEQKEKVERVHLASA